MYNGAYTGVPGTWHGFEGLATQVPVAAYVTDSSG